MQTLYSTLTYVVRMRVNMYSSLHAGSSLGDQKVSE